MSEEQQNEQSKELDATQQQDLFGLEICEWTNSGTTTAHLQSFAIASDGMEYAVKRVNDGVESQIKVNYPMLIPASEWLCYKIAEKAGIATPQCRLLYDKEKQEYVFGSRIELAASQGDHSHYMVTLLREANPYLLKQLWAIHAFDQFVYNIDRHINNYLYTRGRHAVTVQAFDFSLAAFVFGWPKFVKKELPEDCNTVVNWKAIKQLTGVTADYKEAALKVLERLEALPVEHVKQIVSEMPKEWLNDGLVETLMKWWVSPDRLEKIEYIRSEINND
ncbi:hypothetical protein M2G58_21545 [Vibrio vulnificus]|nr:hypothetical protein [Vibrio vulnificus]